jgi:hypothetical protein
MAFLVTGAPVGLAELAGPRRRSTVFGYPLLAGPLVASDEAARSLAAIDPVRLPSCSESSLSGGSRMLGMTYPAIQDSLLVFHSDGRDVLGAGVLLSGPTAEGWASSMVDGEIDSLLLLHRLVTLSLSECRDEGLIVSALCVLRLKHQEACIEG